MKQEVESAPVNSEGELSNKIETAAQIVQDEFIVYEIAPVRLVRATRKRARAYATCLY